MKLQLAYPAVPFAVNQGFGVNGEYYRANGINILGHNGLDLRAFHGQPIYASHEGTAFYENDSSSGQGVVIITKQPYDYKQGSCYFKTIYWHLCDYKKEPRYTSPVYTQQQAGDPRKGVPVRQGDLIGYADNTGLSSGDHLHFGLKPVMPGIPNGTDAADVGIGQWLNVEPNNGYLGAIDPTPYILQTREETQNMIISVLKKLVELLGQKPKPV